MLLGFLNISYAWHGNLAGQVAFPVAVLHLLVQGRSMLLFLLSWNIITKVMTRPAVVGWSSWAQNALPAPSWGFFAVD